MFNNKLKIEKSLKYISIPFLINDIIIYEIINKNNTKYWNNIE